jgi:hypothetical protein
MLIIGKEEIGKAYAFHTIASIDSSFPLAISDEESREWACMYLSGKDAHVSKLLHYRFLLSLMKEYESMQRGKTASEAIKEANYDILDGINALEKKDGMGVRKALKAMDKQASSVNMDKFKGFYVDLEGKKFTTPFDAKYEQLALDCLTELEKLIPFLKERVFNS